MKRLFTILAAVVLAIVPVRGADLSRGITFTDGQRITAAQLHQLVDSGAVATGFYTGKILQTNLTSTDTLLVYSAASGTFHRVTGDQFLLNNVDWINTRSEKLALNTNDYFVFYNVDGGVIGKVGLTNLLYGGNASIVAGATQYTNVWNNFTLLAWDGTSSPTPSNYYRLRMTNIFDNLGTNWPNWFQLGPTNAGHTNFSIPHATLADDFRLWVNHSTTNGGSTNFYSTLGDIKQYVTNASIIGEARDLVMQATNATIQLLTCTDMVLKATNGASYCTGAFTLTNNLALANPTNGVDTGSAGISSNWYYIHVMSDGTNVSTIASLSSNNPALPAPYIYRAMAGPAFYDSASHYYTNYQTGRTVALYSSNLLSQAITASYQTLYAANNASGTALSNAIPPVAVELHGVLGSPGTTLGPITALASDAGGLNEVLVAGQNAGATINSFGAASPFRMTIKTPQTIWIKAADTSARNRLNVTGYRF